MALPSPNPPLESQEACEPADAPERKKHAKTAYFLFSEENRENVKHSLLQDREEGAKVSVADVAKELGARWKQLSAEEREQYKQRCAQLAAERAAAGPDSQEAAKDPSRKASKGHGGLPLSLVKRIACLDEDVTRISGDAVLVLAHATELFIEHLSAKCCAVLNSSKPKRSTIKLSDFTEVVKRDRRLVAAGLRDVVALAQQHADEAAEQRAAEQQAKRATEEAHADPAAEPGQGDNATHKPSDATAGKRKNKKAKQDPAPAATKPITAFFARRTE